MAILAEAGTCKARDPRVTERKHGLHGRAEKQRMRFDTSQALRPGAVRRRQGLAAQAENPNPKKNKPKSDYSGEGTSEAILAMTMPRGHAAICIRTLSEESLQALKITQSLVRRGCCQNDA